MTYAPCALLFTLAGFTATPSLVVLDFDHAVTTQPADRVIHTNLTPGAFVPKTSPLIVTTNPADADMPVVIPAIDPAETGSHYRSRLIALGLLGLFITTDTLSDSDTDPAHGPDEAVRVNPRPGTRVHKGTSSDPSSGTAITVVANPSSAPDATGTDTDPGAGGSGFSPPIPPGIDLAPLSAVAAVGCSSFPFGIPCWTYNVASSWVTGPSAPNFCMPFPFVHPDPCIDMSVWDPGMPIIRAMLLLMSFVGLGWLFMRAALGFGGGGGDED
jgi:hypothetical protein